jgi:hypothetical protein
MMTFSYTALVKIVIPLSTEVLCEGCLFECQSLSSVIFESGSRLSRIESDAFRGTGLVNIIILSPVEIWGGDAFHGLDHFPLLHLSQVRNCDEFK